METNKRGRCGRPARITGTIMNQKLSIRLSESEHAALLLQATNLKTKITDMVRVRLADLLERRAS